MLFAGTAGEERDGRRDEEADEAAGADTRGPHARGARGEGSRNRTTS